MRRSLPLLLGVAAIVMALDRWTKHWASATLPFNRPVAVLGDYVRLTYTRNSGVAFGLGQGTGFPWYVFSIAAVVIILWLLLRRRVEGVPRQLALALILGGALGNLVDRLGSGEVVDFIEVGVPRWHWPVFNVADSAVSVGVILFILTWPSKHEGGPGHEPEAGPGGPGPEPRGAAGPVPGGGPDGSLA
ncbi:MAG TPA: signal peptidase II [Candidatus Eisenbacteria bacterium]